MGASYKAVFAVPHGCAGSPTVKLRVQIPEGVIAVKPMPKAGWTVDIVEGKYTAGVHLSRQQDLLGRQGGGVVRRQACRTTITMNSSCRRFSPTRSKPNTTLVFPVVQECEKGVSRWIDIPAEGGRALA